MNVEISKEDSEYMYNIVQKVIDECGPRMPCSPQEAKAAEFIKKELEQTCDEATIEKFICHPRAFLGWIKINVILVLVSIVCFYLIPLALIDYWQYYMAIVSFLLSLTAFFVIWNEFFNYREFVDPLFKKRESQNVVGKIKSKDEAKNIIIFSGHHDSALQFNLLHKLKIGYGIVTFLGLGVMFTWIIFSIIFVLFVFLGMADYQWFFTFVFVLTIIGSPVMVLLFFFVSPGEKANKVPGAVDNLSAVAIILALGRYLEKHKDIIPKNTEVRLISFGCEEAGLRGAYRYAAAHLEELKEKDAVVVNMDGIQSAKRAAIIANEPTTRTIHDPEVVQKILNAAQLVGVKARIFGLGALEKFIGQISGGTDATAFSKDKVKAASITAMELKKFINYYHQPTDTPDAIDKGALENVLKICIGYLMNASKAK